MTAGPSPRTQALCCCARPIAPSVCPGRSAACFTDGRRQDRIEHSVETLLAQRIHGIALGYEDLNDHDELRHDPVLGLVSGKVEARRSDCAVLAGKSTLNRLEHAPKTDDDRYRKLSVDEGAMKRLFVSVFLKAHATPPKRIILDLDATDDPIHGDQEGRFFHGYYKCYCYLPLYIFCGRDLLLAKLQAREHRRLGRRQGGDRLYRRANPAELAGTSTSGFGRI